MTKTGKSPKVLFSIHDVMPDTLELVVMLLEMFSARELPPPALLVVPGCAWSPDTLDRLRALAGAGCELIAHGWLHYTVPRGVYHRLHARLLSRNVAEHLAFDEQGVEALMRRSAAWFCEHEMPGPRTYIPPAWALGMPAAHLNPLPFDAVETLRGVYLRTAEGFRLQTMPLLGFEADTAMRARCLRLWNQSQLTRARRRKIPLRVCIHPRDRELRLSEDLEVILRQSWRPISYAALAAGLGE